MIHVSAAKVEPTHDAWRTWVEDCRLEREKLIELAKSSPELVNDEIDEDLYKGQRITILRLFNDKCAYCESPLEATQRMGDVEHYRPKGRVTDENGKLVFIHDESGQRRQHPGYFWLAYEWTNLLPACLACNRPGTDSTGVPSGKWDRFPVAGFRATRPGEEGNEDPILLNPWYDDPNQDLKFDPLTGVVGWHSEKGRMNVNILGLNRRGLPEERLRTIARAKGSFWAYIDAAKLRSADHMRASVDEMAKFTTGAEPYSAFGVAKLRLEKAYYATTMASLPF